MKKQQSDWQSEMALSLREIDDVLNYVNSVSNHRDIFFQWRTFLNDEKDALVLEVAVESESQYIITYNKKDFVGIEKFGIHAISPKEFLKLLGE